MQLFKEHATDYIDKGYSVIPDRYMGKAALIKGWTNFCEQIPTKDEINNWCNSYEKANLAVCTGKVSGIIALDLDCVDQEIIDAIQHVLPESPCAKVGSKGWTRFFKYNGEVSNSLKFNDKMIVELLSDGKKTTIPPSVHPNGKSYEWIGKSLLEVEYFDLQDFPPFLFSAIDLILREKFPQSKRVGGKIVNGRNDALSKYCSKLILEATPLDVALTELVKYDKENHETPLFTDTNEMRHDEPFTNALKFYANHLNSFNISRFRDNKTYEKPITAYVVEHEAAKEMRSKKSQSEVNLEKSIPELPKPTGALAAIQDFILTNSYIEQPAFALSAGLVLLATLSGRKFEFEGVAPNLYILNVAPSGAGKDAPQQKLKEILSLIGNDHLLGAGDYVSDASLMDGLLESPVRLDIIDEAGGLLRSVNKGGATFNGKMADILAELYTCSNSIFLGRMTAMGHKGRQTRPNVNLLCSTTPTGFQQGVSTEAIEKGLMGRFLVFKGEYGKPARRIENPSTLDKDSKNLLEYLAAFTPPKSGKIIGDFEQDIFLVDKTPEANVLLDEKFKEFDELRRNSDPLDKLLPIISRLYQQLLKIALLSSVSNMVGKPLVKKEDVEFAYNMVIYYFHSIKEMAENNIFRNKTEEDTAKVLRIIKSSGEKGLSTRDLSRKARWLKKRERDEILKDLLENNFITLSIVKTAKRNKQVYRSTEC